LGSDAAATYHALEIWARCAGFRTTQALYEREPVLGCEVSKLERHLYGGTAVTWSGPALFDAASTVRTSRLAAQSDRRPAALPALNP